MGGFGFVLSHPSSPRRPKDGAPQLGELLRAGCGRGLGSCYPTHR
jgi:hypothetical protein